jgi:Bifunctional DNA primase/polymerase, N-terminal
MSGAFATAALDLYGAGLKQIPTGGEDGKTPLVRGWGCWKRQSRSTVEHFARKHPDANTGVLTGLSGITIVDYDDERTLASAEFRFGNTPLVTRTPRGGGHLWFRSSGERSANLRGFNWNIDVKGIGGYVVAPPSRKPGGGVYRLERGSWDALHRLPTIAAGAIPSRSQHIPADLGVPVDRQIGNRINALFLGLRQMAPSCETPAELIVVGRRLNASCSSPLPPAEVERTARSVWKIKVEGRLILPGQQRILMLPADLENLNADAFYLLAWVKKWHSARIEPFALSVKAMEKSDVVPV